MLTSNFKYKEFIVSDKYPSLLKSINLDENDRNIIKLGIESCLQPFRTKFKHNPVIITSGKRSNYLNNLVGGSVNSDHLTANAVDFYVKGMHIINVYSNIIKLSLPYRELILYLNKNVIHLSWNIPGKIYKHRTDVIL